MIPLTYRCLIAAVAGILLLAIARAESAQPALIDATCRLNWTRGTAGWRLEQVAVTNQGRDQRVGTPSGEYTVLFSAEPPATTPESVPWRDHSTAFPEPPFRYTAALWAEATSPVALNTAGVAENFYPETVEQKDGALVFGHRGTAADVSAEWRLDPAYPGDVRVTVTLTAKKDGFYSIATPTLITSTPGNLRWAMVPGYFQGAGFEPDFVRAYAYGQGLPERPVLVRERAAGTLASILTEKSGLTVAVVAEPGMAADPWATNRHTRQQWRLGLSHMNRAGLLSPTLYHPVLGQDGSRLAAGESRSFSFRFALRAADWMEVQRHVAYDLYRLGDFLAMKQPARSLTERVLAMSRYVVDDQLSYWRLETTTDGLTIGAQSYLGGVLGSDKDAMKNSDYGAMWMLARLTRDPKLVADRLPYARNFKLAQQQTAPGFFQGAAVGQYYLWKSRRFTEEWGNYVEPVALTFYTMLDDGNILLFEPKDQELRNRLRLGADRLLNWQRPDGSWEVAYDRASEQPTFRDLTDFRPTFYGLIVAYRILGDEKYLAGARRGADWLLREAVEPGRFLGVCGDSRFAPDFATAQIAGGLLDLYEITKDTRYRDAAVRTAQFYTTSIYTHPIATQQEKTAGGATRPDWEISQFGLGFEHGGLIGSANRHGPILLASHAGLFIRLHQLTGEPLFRDLARAGALARDAFVDPKTSVASYYWEVMNRGAGPYPHHAWWQIGWITDYLLSEAMLRTNSEVLFPRGFMTPKVGPHACYGFAPGKILGQPATLVLRPGLVRTSSPGADYVTAVGEAGNRLFVIVLNNLAQAQTIDVTADPASLPNTKAARWASASWLRGGGEVTAAMTAAGKWPVSIPAYGVAVLAVDFAEAEPVKH